MMARAIVAKAIRMLNCINTEIKWVTTYYYLTTKMAGILGRKPLVPSTWSQMLSGLGLTSQSVVFLEEHTKLLAFLILKTKYH